MGLWTVMPSFAASVEVVHGGATKDGSITQRITAA